MSIPFDPRWSASVDGKPGRLFAADEALMALPLTAGNHQIALRYRDGGVVWGGSITLASVAASLLILVLPLARAARRKFEAIRGGPA
jgi:uncharacterized membrane protein YfhO